MTTSAAESIFRDFSFDPSSSSSTHPWLNQPNHFADIPVPFYVDFLGPIDDASLPSPAASTTSSSYSTSSASHSASTSIDSTAAPMADLAHRFARQDLRASCGSGYAPTSGQYPPTPPYDEETFYEAAGSVAADDDDGNEPGMPLAPPSPRSPHSPLPLASSAYQQHHQEHHHHAQAHAEAHTHPYAHARRSASPAAASSSAAARPQSLAQLRAQRQAAARLHCDDAHVRRVRDLVARMVERREQCAVGGGRLGTVGEEDEGMEGGVEEEGEGEQEHEGEEGQGCDLARVRRGRARECLRCRQQGAEAWAGWKAEAGWRVEWKAGWAVSKGARMRREPRMRKGAYAWMGGRRRDVGRA
ncbi:hypothetical protein BDY21DRAFT_367030 [Lineolata rhizophorae]|uniref:Uncharacterized protein n=1 Tax=Lineolata rhizophorae TaxID=578093 RepID=A0A6A6NQ23_9PEZI|nr:hypothetical protein BDY21DRAFT_367030 [Lineolata rhizophorae]